MNPWRRTLLRGVPAALLLPWIGAGLLVPRRAIAADWNRAAFTAKTVVDALPAAGLAPATGTADILINGPEIAENGAKVDIEITSQIPGSQRITVLADKNPLPLAADFQFTPPALPFVRVQLKLAETTRVRAVVKAADGKTYVAGREIKVTLGGCGG